MTFKNIALAAVGALLSIPVAVNMEEVLHYRTPGVRLAFTMFYGNQSGADLREIILVQVGFDSVLCFAVMCGLYVLYSRVRKKS